VSPSSKSEAVDANFGGQGTKKKLRGHSGHCTSAYMLIYIRQSHIGLIF